MTDISAVLTGHREGLFSGPSIESFEEAVTIARRSGLTVETIAVLDRTDDATRVMFSGDTKVWDRIIECDYGDPALSRNRGAHEASGEYIAFLDGDDLWSFNWLIACHQYAREVEPTTILHSELNVVFGGARQFWCHADSQGHGFDAGYLSIGNYWDALCFCRRQIYLDIPFVANDLRRGYGHEDWHWNCVTLLSGFSHRPTPGTVHFKRRRLGSQSAAADERDVIPWPTDARFLWRSDLRAAGAVECAPTETLAASRRRQGGTQ